MAAIASEFKRTLLGARVDKIYQPSKLEIIMTMRQPGHNITVIASSQPEAARVHITRGERENPLVPPAFCMLLRKYLAGSRVMQVAQLGLDRVLKITFVRSREETPKTLVIEVMGRHSNMALVDEGPGMILDSMKHIGSDVSRVRQMGPGIQYIPPPAQDKLNLLLLSNEDLDRVLREFQQASPTASCSKFLMSSFSGLGRDSAAKVLSDAGIIGNDPCVTLKGVNAERLLNTLLELAEDIRKERFLPCPSQLLDSVYSREQDQMTISNLRTRLLAVVDGNIARCGRKLKAQEDATAQAKKDLECRKIGELITVNAPGITPGQETVRLVDYYDPLEGHVEVRLDPRLSPYENAQRYFARYTRAKRTLESVRGQIEATQRELDYLDQVAMTLHHVDTLGDMESIHAELIEQGYLEETPRKRARSARAESSREVSFLSFTIEGYEVIVGRNNKENDYLTMKVANADDIWMHARGISGSHVIVRAGSARDPIPEKVIAAAAEIASYYSKGRQDSKVPVDYTLRRHVRKPKGARPGMVIYSHERTITVNPRSPASKIMQ